MLVLIATCNIKVCPLCSQLLCEIVTKLDNMWQNGSFDNLTLYMYVCCSLLKSAGCFSTKILAKDVTIIVMFINIMTQCQQSLLVLIDSETLELHR